MKLTLTHLRWMARWQGNSLTPTHFMGPIEGFATKRQCREFIQLNYGYIATRKDLRRAPHWWRMPKPIKVQIKVTEL